MSDHSTAAPTGRKRRALGPGLTAFLVVDILLVAAFVVVAVNAPQRGGGPETQESTAAEPETTPDATAPADPQDATAIAAFALPSGNIHCEMTETTASCTILSFSYERPAAPEGCTGTAGNVLLVSAETEEVSFPCLEGEPAAAGADVPVLEYGEASTVGDMTCQSSRNGASCRHNPSGAGFSVARAGYTIF